MISSVLPAIRRSGLTALVLVGAACSAPDSSRETAGEDATSRPSVEAALARSTEWVEFNDPDRSWGGYTLALYRRRVPFLMDMDGRVVHSWPNVRVGGRARVTASGHLVVLTNRGRLREYDWDGNPTWSFKPPKDSRVLHHDFAILRNGHFLLLSLRRGRRSDDLIEVDRSGKVTWRWSSHEAMPEEVARGPERDRTHMNSIEELPANRWHDQGNDAFRPGNILVSARNLNTLYIVSRPEGEVVWKHDTGMDLQHEARMVPPGIPGAGNIVVFNNRYHDPERRSAIIELNPVSRSVVWSYEADGFFSGTGGTQQVLPNGSLLVTSSRGGRVFEVTREGSIVWQWVPPFLPMRALRYSEDHCPQLSALGPVSREAVSTRDPERFIDADQYRFALTHEVKRIGTGGAQAKVLTRPNDCQQLRLPDRPQLTLEYGMNGHSRCEDAEGHRARFAVSIRSHQQGEPRNLLLQTVGPDDFGPETPGEPISWRRETLSLHELEREKVEMCLSLTGSDGGPVPPCFVWGPPLIRSAARRDLEPLEADGDVAPEVLEHQRQQLEALGYVN